MRAPWSATALCLSAWLAVSLPFLTVSAVRAGGEFAAYRDPARPVSERVDDLMARMTLAEKVALLAGGGWTESRANTRLGIPAIRMADGPLGVRNWTGSSAVTLRDRAHVLATAVPAGIALASSWDLKLAGDVGRVVAQETKAFGRDMILGPTVNINRVPVWGRNFEGYGEDPYLAARLGVAWIRAVQAEKVIPSVKHFAANNEEFERHRLDESIDRRALHEIYFPAFKAAVQEAGVWAVMSAYQKVNGLYCSENPFLLKETLQRRWGFQGFVLSDWGSTYSTPGPLSAGMNLEMPGGEALHRWVVLPATREAGNAGGYLEADKVMAALRAGTVREAAVADSARRILRVMFLAGLFDHPVRGGEVDTPPQRAVARQAADEGVVLLRNEGGLLPWAAGKLKSLAVIGPSAAIPRTGGGGSSLVNPAYAITPLEGIKEAVGSGVEVRSALGARMVGEETVLEPGETAESLRGKAAAVAARSDAAVVVVGNWRKTESESFDRASMDLPAGQDELIAAVAAANPRTVIVVISGSPVTMTAWVRKVPAVVFAWYGGQEAGHAVADVLFGRVNPSGKTPVTFPRRWEDTTAYGNYPGKDLHVTYAEGIYVGYRGFDRRGVEPLYPFGFGLSYTRFEYTDLSVSKDGLARFTIRNAGSRAGAEVAQLYVHPTRPAALDRPRKELKGFARVELPAGGSQRVSIKLDRSAAAYFDPARDDWVVERGTYEVWVGASSADIRLKADWQLR